MRRNRLRALLALVVLSVFFHAPDTVYTLEGYAILERQPTLSRGVPVLPTNTIRYVWSTYEYEGSRIDVYVVPESPDRSAVPDEREWVAEDCAGRRLDLERTDGGSTRPVLRRTRREGYVLYVGAPEGAINACSFVDAFLEVFEFFLGETPQRIETLRPPPEFPGVLTPDR